jgi:lipopolysaccharide export system permease protein
MTPPVERIHSPTLAGYLRRQVLRLFALALASLVSLSLIADFFDRVDTILENEAGLGTILRAFLFRMPQVVTEVTPLAVLAGTLVGLGLMARHREFVAMRACGVSSWQVLRPLLLLALGVSVATLVWNETVVPYSARRWHEIWTQEVKRSARSVFAGRQVWYRGQAGFYNIERANPRRRALYGLTVYQIGEDFRPSRVIVAPRATWDGAAWELHDAETHELSPEGVRVTAGVPEGFGLPETLEDFSVAELEPEAFGYRMLRRQIEALREKGVDTSESWVDLYLKLALPAAAVIMMVVAVPLAIRSAGTSSLPAAVAMGFAVGFAYFMLVGFARALGQNGALPPLLAAWAANAIFLMLGGYLVLGAD